MTSISFRISLQLQPPQVIAIQATLNFVPLFNDKVVGSLLHFKSMKIQLSRFGQRKLDHSLPNAGS